MPRSLIRLYLTAALAALLAGCTHGPIPPASTQRAIDSDIAAAQNTGATAEQLSEAPTAIPNVTYWLPSGITPLQQP